MRNSKLLANIRTGKPARLALLGHYIPEFVAFAARDGYDAVWLDLEHRVMDEREVQALLAFFRLYDIDCLLRPGTREKSVLARYLVDGAAGIVIPQVSTVEEARDLVRKVKFPPIGDRGIEGYSFETNYGLDTRDSMKVVEHANREVYLIVQIETPEGVDNVDEIAALPGVDGLYIGTTDLNIRLPNILSEKRPSIEEIMAHVAEACRKNGKMWGQFARSPEDLKLQIELGANLIMVGVDTRLLDRSVAQSAAELDNLLKDR
jgi:4-hydroxy-2-oxoheptanedioate aldolase